MKRSWKDLDIHHCLEKKMINKKFLIKKILNKNIDKIKDHLKNAATEKEYDKLFNNMNDRVNVLKKLVKTVFNNVEKKKKKWCDKGC